MLPYGSAETVLHGTPRMSSPTGLLVDGMSVCICVRPDTPKEAVAPDE